MNGPAYPERLVSLTIGAVYIVILLVCVILHLRYSFGPFHAQFNSDSAAGVLYAHEIIAQHSLFPQWNDSTGMLNVMSMPNLWLTAITLSLQQDWFTASRVGIALDQCLMFTLLWWALRRIGMPRTGRLLLLGILLVGPSWWFLHQTTLLAGRSWTFTLLLVFIVLARAASDGGADARKAWYALSMLGTLVFPDAANASTLLLPLGVGLAMEWVVAADPSARRRIALPFTALLTGLLAGQLLRYTVLVHNHYQTYKLPFTDVHEAGAHAGLLLLGLVELFGGAAPAGATPYSLTGLADGCKFLLLVLSLALPFHIALRRQTPANSFVRILSWVTLTSLLLKLYVYLFTGISADSALTARYFIPEILLGLVLAILYLDERLREPWLRNLVLVAAIVPFLISSPLLQTAAAVPSQDQQLASALKAAGLKHGYATFWNANAPTALASGEVTVRQIEFTNRSIQPMLWLSADRWYAGTDVRESYLLLSDNEIKTVDLTNFDAAVGSPSREVDLGGFRARVYPFDLAQRLGWRYAINAPLPASAMRAEIESLAITPDPAGHAVRTRWRIRNPGPIAFSSYGSAPVNFGLHLVAMDGHDVTYDLIHAPIPLLLPGASVETEVPIPRDRLGEGNSLRADLVQEGVAWFGDRGSATIQVAVPNAPEGTTSSGR